MASVTEARGLEQTELETIQADAAALTITQAEMSDREVFDTNKESMKAEVDKPKKKSKKSKTKGQKKRATGFEEFYCDPPMTPEEHKHEIQVLYPPHRPFDIRIEECVQRYRARRRLDSQRNHIFSKYLELGGLDTGARNFQGAGKMDKSELEGLTKSDAREMMAEDVIFRGAATNPRWFNPSSPEHWDVDFSGVAAGFLSERLPSLVGHGPEYLVGVEVVLNFLKYVAQHDVCPEYADDLEKAQGICHTALGEMPNIEQLGGKMPGIFQAAARAFYCDDSSVQDANMLDFNTPSAIDFKNRQEARTVMGVMLACSSTLPPNLVCNGALTKSKGTCLASSSRQQQTFEVTAIVLASTKDYSAAQQASEHLAQAELMDIKSHIRPCGYFSARPVTIRDGWDLGQIQVDRAAQDPKEELFILDDDLLKLLKAGMKMKLSVEHTDAGINVIRGISAIHPTFYEFLPQELMLDYKEPVPSERPGASVFDGPEDYGGGVDLDD